MKRAARTAILRAAVLLPTLALVLPTHARWGTDINPGTGPALLAQVLPEVAALLAAPPAERPALLEEYARGRAGVAIEALKRLRNPELEALFLRLLEHEDWHVVHRALYALEYYGGPAVLDRAWDLLRHPAARLREKAAITCIKSWDGRRGRAPDVEALLFEETDFHVRRCLEALLLRLRGRLTVQRVHEEHVVRGEGGVLLTPFLSGMDTVASVAPDYRARVVGRQGRGPRRRKEPARWTTPLLGYGEEEVPGTSLQPFANLRQGGRVYHLGQDVGACLDGAGYYSPSVGTVRFVHTGSDMGTLIVTEHDLGGGRLVNAVFMHGGDTVFVEAGDEVETGQLLGTMGMGYSIENGGHFAHLHFGLYPGPFSTTHNYGYRSVERGLSDWYDPAVFLPAWIERTWPVVEDLPALDRGLGSALRQLENGRYGAAYLAAVRRRESAPEGSAIRRDAARLVSALQSAPRNALRRVRGTRDAGFPAAALEALEDLVGRGEGIPGWEDLAAERVAWLSDPAFRRGLEGEERVERAERRAARGEDAAAARALWEELLEEYGDTCLAPRIRERLR